MTLTGSAHAGTPLALDNPTTASIGTIIHCARRDLTMPFLHAGAQRTRLFG